MKGTMFAVASLAVLLAIPVDAHHSFDLTFDRDDRVGMLGRVTEFSFANPHSYFKLEVVDANRDEREWYIETTSAGQLANHGWNSHSIMAGEILAVEGFRARNGHAYVRLQSMSHASDETVPLWLPAGPTMLSGS